MGEATRRRRRRLEPPGCCETRKRDSLERRAALGRRVSSRPLPGLDCTPGVDTRRLPSQARDPRRRAPPVQSDTARPAGARRGREQARCSRSRRSCRLAVSHRRQRPSEQISGYDVALLYDPAVFRSTAETASFTIHNRFSTRDILRVTLECTDGTALIVYVVHWPSRRMSGSEPLRIASSSFLSALIERDLKFAKEELFDRLGRPQLPARQRLRARWETPLLVLGDFNDNPFDVSMTTIAGSTRDLSAAARPPRLPLGSGLRSVAAYLSLQPRLHKPAWQIMLAPQPPLGTYQYAGEWDLLDQALVSAGLLGTRPPRVPSRRLSAVRDFGS